MKLIKSPLRYPGGKSKAIKYIAPLIPAFEEYREPFLGGGSVFVYLKQIFPNKIFWINDIYENLFLFWKYAQNETSELLIQINKWKNKFNEGKELYFYLVNNINRFTELEKAAAFFVLNRITFSGTSESGGFSKQAYNKRFTESSIRRVLLLSNILSNVLITNYDYKKIVMYPGNNVFIFLDPPYFSAKKSALYGKNGNLHKYFDYEEFADIMKKVKHKWLITLDNSEYIKKLFSYANIIEWGFKYGMTNVNNNKVSLGKELFIANYDIKAVNENLLTYSKHSKKNAYKNKINAIKTRSKLSG